jgi:GAF domain-containing protein
MRLRAARVAPGAAGIEARAPRSPDCLIWSVALAVRNDDMRVMYDFRIDAADKAEAWRQTVAAADALTIGEPDAIANMANVAALLFETLPDLNWAGFYRNVGGELVLGPFQGRAACIRIPFGKGVCGAAAASLEPQCVDDVDAFPGHIACDAASASELVVPLVHEGRLLGVIDLDSPSRGRFDAADLAGCLELAQMLAPRLA